MSHFYGTLNGKAGPATRCGSKRSGLYARAASWSGCILTVLSHDPETGLDHYAVYQVRWCGRGVERLIASGIVGQFPDEEKDHD